jgi:hypothetical protein
MLRTISPTAPGFEAAVRLLQGGRRPSTVKSYDQKWLKSEAFTSQAQSDAGAPCMCALSVSSQTIVSYLGYLLEAGTISAKSLQPYLSAINAVHNDFEYPPPTCGHLVKLVRKGFSEQQGSVMLQPQQVTTFSAEHVFAIVQFGLRPDTSKHHIRVCVCLTAQFAFFSRADSGVLLAAINVQVSSSTLSIINPPRMSPEIKRHPPPEYRQFKTIRTTDSTCSRCSGKFCVPIATRTSTGPLKTILSRGSKTQVS